MLIEEKLGTDLYNTVYQMLELDLGEGTDASERQQAINEIC